MSDNNQAAFEQRVENYLAINDSLNPWTCAVCFGLPVDHIVPVEDAVFCQSWTPVVNEDVPSVTVPVRLLFEAAKRILADTAQIESEWGYSRSIAQLREEEDESVLLADQLNAVVEDRIS